MFGSIFRMRPKPGAKDKIIQLSEEETRERGATAGFRVSYLLETADGGLMGMAVFDDEKTYRDNAADPEQDKWYRRLRELLEADPEWNDGTIHEWRA